MRTIIAGSLTLGWQDLEPVLKAYRLPISEVVCGCVLGIDRVGYKWAREHNIPVRFFPSSADQYSWAFFSKRPVEIIVYPKGGYSGTYKGNLRTVNMTGYADALIAVWDGTCKDGTKTLIKWAEVDGLTVCVNRVNLR